MLEKEELLEEEERLEEVLEKEELLEEVLEKEELLLEEVLEKEELLLEEGPMENTLINPVAFRMNRMKLVIY